MPELNTRLKSCVYAIPEARAETGSIRLRMMLSRSKIVFIISRRNSKRGMIQVLLYEYAHILLYIILNTYICVCMYINIPSTYPRLFGGVLF